MNKIGKIALIGLGKMGSALATRLLAAGFDLTVYNRTAEKAQPLVILGAKAAASAAEAVSDADVVVTCLFDDNSVLEVLNAEQGVLTGLKRGAIHIGTSTILPETSKKLTELHQVAGSIYVAGNVLGVPAAAARGELISIVAGDAAAVTLCTPIFNAYSSHIMNLGEQAYKANVMKICCNYLLVTNIEAMGELYTFAEKSGLETDSLGSMFHSVFALPAYKLYVDKIRQRDFASVNFDLKSGFKDLNLFQQAFTEVQVTSEMANVVKNKMIVALAQGREHEDWSAVTEVTRSQAGLS